MGRWGMGLFEGDFDLDLAGSISDDAGCQLYNYEIDTEYPEYSGKGLEATQEHLNNGTLARLFQEYATTRVLQVFEDVPKDLTIIFLGKRCSPFYEIHDCPVQPYTPLLIHIVQSQLDDDSVLWSLQTSALYTSSSIPKRANQCVL